MHRDESDDSQNWRQDDWTAIQPKQQKDQKQKRYIDGNAGDQLRDQLCHSVKVSQPQRECTSRASTILASSNLRITDA